MEENNYTFDDLFENKPELKPETKTNDYSVAKGFLIIGIYFAVFALFAFLIQLIFLVTPGMIERYDATEGVVRYLSKNDGIGYTTLDQYNALENKDRIQAVIKGDYVILLSKDTFGEETFDDMYLEIIFSGDSFTYNEKQIKRINNQKIEGFFRDDFEAKYDVSIGDYQNFTVEANVLINFLTYFVATVILIVLSIHVLKADFQRLDKKVLPILSMIGLGYLFMMGGNIIGNALSMFLSQILNHPLDVSVNQEAINQTLTSSLAPLMIVATVIGAPIVEELVFRKGFFSIIKNKWVALVISSLVFSLMHILGETSFQGFIINFFIYGSSGAALGFVYIYFKKNIYAPMMVHALSNLIAVLAFYFLPGLI